MDLEVINVNFGIIQREDHLHKVINVKFGRLKLIINV